MSAKLVSVCLILHFLDKGAFCPECGHKLEDDSKEEDKSSKEESKEKSKEDNNPEKSCSNCGAKVSKDSKFCPECGNKIK